MDAVFPSLYSSSASSNTSRPIPVISVGGGSVQFVASSAKGVGMFYPGNHSHDLDSEMAAHRALGCLISGVGPDSQLGR